MPKELLNEAERYLVEHWAEARLLEETMDSVRTKYKEVFERIIEAVTEAHPDLTTHVCYPIQLFGSGSIGFGRKSWPDGESRWPSGFWIFRLRLEVLAADDNEPPYACIRVSEKSNLDLASARIILKEAAKDIITPKNLKTLVFEETGETLMWWPAPSKSEFLSAFCKADGQEFVELIVAEFELMARFVPVLEKVFHECSRKE